MGGVQKKGSEIGRSQRFKKLTCVNNGPFKPPLVLKIPDFQEKIGVDVFALLKNAPHIIEHNFIAFPRGLNP